MSILLLYNYAIVYFPISPALLWYSRFSWQAAIILNSLYCILLSKALWTYTTFLSSPLHWTGYLLPDNHHFCVFGRRGCHIDESQGRQGGATGCRQVMCQSAEANREPKQPCISLQGSDMSPFTHIGREISDWPFICLCNICAWVRLEGSNIIPQLPHIQWRMPVTHVAKETSWRAHEWKVTGETWSLSSTLKWLFCKDWYCSAK